MIHDSDAHLRPSRFGSRATKAPRYLAVALAATLSLLGCGRSQAGASNATPLLHVAPPTVDARVAIAPVVMPRRLLFIGNSFTYSHYFPVRGYNAGAVIDERLAGYPAMRRGGVPGIIARFAEQQDAPTRIHMLALGLSNLSTVAALGARVVEREPWDAVVLQDHSDEVFAPARASTTCRGPLRPGEELACATASIAREILRRNRDAKIYVVENPAPPDVVERLHATEAGAEHANARNFSVLLARNPEFARVAWVGRAFEDARLHEVAAPQYPNTNLAARPWLVAKLLGRSERLAVLYARYVDPSYQPGSGRIIECRVNVAPNGLAQLFGPDDHHFSTAGSYLSALVQYATLTHADPRSLGLHDAAARELGLEPRLASALQIIAARSAVADHIRLIRPAHARRA